MRMELQREPGLHVLAVRHRAQPRNVEVRLLDIAADLGEQLPDQLLRSRVMDEPRLEVGEDLRVLLRRALILRDGWIVRSEDLLGHLARQAQRPPSSAPGE